jgi:ketoreductase RED2
MQHRVTTFGPMSKSKSAQVVVGSEFEGRVAIVTGSSSGIGEQTARRLSALGATVVVNSASSVEAGQAISEELPGESTYIQADIADQAQGWALVDGAVSKYGRLDFLINNAGWTTQVAHHDLGALTDEVFQKTFDVNVFGTWWLTKYAIPHLRESDDANIVNITSIAGVRPVGSSIAYSMTKAALNQMTLLLAKSYGPIRVNAVAPGLVATPWTADWEAMHAGVAAMSPVGRSATPDDCAEAVLALLRNKYTSGEIFVVDGGLTQVM